MSELARVLERVRQRRRSRARSPNGNGPAVCPETRMGCALLPGTLVFDTVSGEEGRVLGSTRENVVVAAPKR